MAVWNKLLDPDFWVTLWSKLLGFDFWGTVWKSFSPPEIVIPLISLLLLATYLGWKIRGGFDDRKIKGMKSQTDTAEQRLLSTEEQRAAGADVDREVDELTKQVLDLKEHLETRMQSSELAARVSAMAQTVTKLTTANNELQRTFIGPRTTTIPARR
jgi:F0F1-type ATP synthase membrane subunit b/b'